MSKQTKEKYLWNQMSRIHGQITEIESIQKQLDKLIEELIEHREEMFHFITSEKEGK